MIESQSTVTGEDLEPPRRCADCGRRMIVQVLPYGWTARCSVHGMTTAEGVGPFSGEPQEHR
ncbi:MAG: hypothetical protein ACRCTR_02355 [Actinomycetota bacterium]